MAPFKPPAIAIIGGGPCGLTFARLLQTAGIEYRVFERDASPEMTTRNQGGTLDIHHETGQEALRHAGLHTEFEKLARHDATEMTVMGPNGENRASFANDTDRPEIDRSQLRRLLIDSLPADRIQWGKALSVVERNETDKRLEPRSWALRFADGTTEAGFRLVVAPETLTRPGGDVDPADMDKARATMLGPGGFYAQWASNTRALIAASEGPWRPWPLYRLPIGIFSSEETEGDDINKNNSQGNNTSWSRTTGVVLLGDAAHLATPNGEGVNQAMYDSLVLFQKITTELGNVKSETTSNEADRAALERAVAAYEAEMWPRAREHIQSSIYLETLMYADDGVARLTGLFNEAHD